MPIKKKRHNLRKRLKKEVRGMKFDDSLLTGIVLGITMGLIYGVSLVNFMPFFVLLTILSLVRYLRAH